MATKEKMIISFEVSKTTANRMEAIRKWKDPEQEKIWDINHYAKRRFLEGFKEDDAAKTAYDKKVKAEKEAEKRRKEEEKRRKEQEEAMLLEPNSVDTEMVD